MSARICYVHVGTHKTGTTSIQRFLAQNGGIFRGGDVHVPIAGRIPHHDGHHNIAWELQRSSRFDAAHGTFDLLLAEIETIGKRTACISSEDFGFLHRDRSALRRLTDGLASINYEPRIIVYLRPQLEYARALWVEFQRQGIAIDLRDVLDDALHHGTIGEAPNATELEYDRMLDVFAAAVGKNNLIVRPFRSRDGNAALIKEFFEIIAQNSPLPYTSVVIPDRINASPPIARDMSTLRVYADAINERFTASRRNVFEQYGVDIPIVGDAVDPDSNAAMNSEVSNAFR